MVHWPDFHEVQKKNVDAMSLIDQMNLAAALILSKTVHMYD